MSDPVLEDAPWSAEEMQMVVLAGQPPPGFDCAADAQNRFLYDRAWRDQKLGISITHLLLVQGFPAAYVTLMNDRIQLGPDEKPKGVTWRILGAGKLCQLGVSRAFQGLGLGKLMVAYAIEQARSVGAVSGCRYLTLEAEPHLVPWYQSQGFVLNRIEQGWREEQARERGRSLGDLPVSLRFDLREPGMKHLPGMKHPPKRKAAEGAGD